MNTPINRITGVAVIAAAMLASTAVAQPTAAPSPGDKPGVVMTDVVELTARVDAVDYRKRLVTLTGPQGNTVVVKAGPEVKNLEQIKPGDQLIVRHYESVALFVRKSSDPPVAAEASAVAVAAKGDKPAGIMVDTAEITARVEAIDYAKRTVTLKGPEGKSTTLKVDPSVKRFPEIKKGDEVVVRRTEALAVAVRKP